MSDFVRQQDIICDFSTSDSWVILSPIEQSIKKKIEAIGTPLKDWDINIYRGVLTGCNEAFIINTEKRDEILANCQTDDERTRTAELIRPILRGRDIKRYGYVDNGLFLINTHNGIKNKLPRIDINDYPAVKVHLDQYWDRISTRADKGDTPYNLRNCAYWEDFSKPKIMYSEIVRSPQFYLDEQGKFFPEATTFILIGEHLRYLYNIFHSKVFTYFFKHFYAGGGLGEDGYRYKKVFFEKLPIPKMIGTPNQQVIESANENINIEKNCLLLFNFSEDEIQEIDRD